MIIGIIGEKGSGKTTLANMLTTYNKFKELMFATPLKQICLVLGIPYRSLYGTQKDKEDPITSIGMSGREVMQQLGTELFRERFREALPNFQMKDDSIWIHIMRQRILEEKGDVVVSDVRYLDEARLIQELGGTLIHLRRDSEHHSFWKRMFQQTTKHSSETELNRIYQELDNVVVVSNNGPKENMYTKVCEILKLPI